EGAEGDEEAGSAGGCGVPKLGHIGFAGESGSDPPRPRARTDATRDAWRRTNRRVQAPRNTGRPRPGRRNQLPRGARRNAGDTADEVTLNQTLRSVARSVARTTPSHRRERRQRAGR